MGGYEKLRALFLQPGFLRFIQKHIIAWFLFLGFPFPFPILLAILLNEVRVRWFKKAVQTASYLPTFLSVVIISSMIIDFLSPNNGLINRIIKSVGFEGKYFLIDPNWFRPIYVMSEIWSTTGYEAIIFLAAIAGISPTLYEAARVDGASRFRMIWHITLPGLMSTILIIFILKTGSMIRVGYEKVLLLYNAMTYDVADVFSTFVYRKGLLESNFSYGAAVGMFEAVVAMVMLMSANYISKRLGGNGLW